MKALIKTLIAFTMISIAGVAYSESLMVINLWNGAEVNKNHFTIVAKGMNFAEGDQLTIQVTILNETTGVISTEALVLVAK